MLDRELVRLGFVAVLAGALLVGVGLVAGPAWAAGAAFVGVLIVHIGRLDG